MERQRTNQLFLSEIINLGNKQDQGDLCSLAICWFRETLRIITAGARVKALAHILETDTDFTQFASEYLGSASTGIEKLKIDTQSVKRTELKELPPEIWPAIMKGGDERGSIESVDGGTEIFFDRSDSEVVTLRRISALHKTTGGNDIIFPISEESDGTKQLLNLLPALYLLHRKNGVIIIDELERSMHPALAHKFVEFFTKTAKDTSSQLIFTTHESTLLDQSLLRRDGVWFTEKDKAGATQLYALSEFKVRNDLKLEKGYLRGRFGAIPFLGGIDRLIDRATNQEEAE